MGGESGGLLYNTKQDVGCFQNKYGECFQKVSERQMVDEGKANTDILSVYFLLKKIERIL